MTLKKILDKLDFPICLILFGDTHAYFSNFKNICQKSVSHFFQVRRKSKAYRRLREGDRIVSINGRSCEGLTYDQLMDIADKSDTDLTLEVLR